MDLATCDAAYLFLGRELKAKVITADEKMLQKAKPYFPILPLKDYI